MGGTASQAAFSGGQKADDGDVDSNLESEDDMDSVVGADLNRKEDESVQQHKLRLARMLKERATKRKEAKRKEARAGKKAKDGQKAGGDGKGAVTHKKKVNSPREIGTDAWRQRCGYLLLQ